MRLSSEECTSSSQEIVPCRTSKDSGISVPPPSSSVESETEIVPSKSSNINVTEEGEKPIVSESNADEEAQNYGEVVNNLLKKQSENVNKKRKVDESWVVKEESRSKPKRVIIESSDDDDFEEDDLDDDEDDWEDKKRPKAKAKSKQPEKKKVLTKKSPIKKVTKVKEDKPCSPKANPEGSLSPKTPLSDHNRIK